MVLKILAVEQSYDPEVFGRRPRQLFVTQSRILAAKVREYYHTLSLPFRKDEQQDPGADGEVTSTFAMQAFGSGVDLLGIPGGLPETFSALEDKHFPLFLSFEQVKLTNQSP
jgi:hypothetical protein